MTEIRSLEQPAARTLFCELAGAGLIRVSGADAVAFLQGQLTGDIAGMRPPQTQYSGYCSPQGRLLATFLVWRGHDEIVLQLPLALLDSLQARLLKYVLRARVTLVNATQSYRLFGVSGPQAHRDLESLIGPLPQAEHEVVSTPGISVTSLPVERYLVLAQTEQASRVRSALSGLAQECVENAWSRCDIQAGIAVITPATQEEYVPQMVNLDLIGGVSYRKGCYPGQEIVARMHYLGRLKQRMYRVHLPLAQTPAPGDALYSLTFGPDQSCGALVDAAPAAAGGFEALAVVQTASVAQGSVHWKSLDGPVLDFLPLPYVIPS